ncbi:glycosyltransferase family 4 protein [Alcaligenes endophyticus]|uniref:Glycosyltransferase family 4 protein n=1 Tax=Alcaligenes endophyticus TaxID=1929088 RepID=A0ABT8EFF7_9BURK|nr:glycosyltransferase family 4 protein [Alcaligenes endophyticus]MCX5590322.1 glycosyltransferase family 4 protein [Alcaligenes endophyticus]MDN4120014.1 glycosyltransferase family 4 protein [Alcaligenes endophyticus]
MRILMLNTERGWRGGERQTLLSLQQFQAAGHEVTLLARHGHELARRANASGIAVKTVAGPFAAMVYLLSHGRRFDIIHAQTAASMSWLAVLAPILGPRIVFTRRTAFPVDKAGNDPQALRPTLSAKEKRTLWKWRQATALVAISQAAAAEPRRLGLAVDIIGSAIDYQAPNPEHIEQLRQRYQLQRYTYVVGTAAAQTPEKDPATLVRAIHALYLRRQDFIFLHFGASGSETPALQGLIQQYGLQSCYILCGFQEQVQDIYRLLDVFVLSSRHEALGSSVLDAFVYKVPVVATTTGGLPELLGKNRGLACAVGDHMSMATAIERLLNEPSLREQLQHNAYEWVLRTHGVQSMAQQYLRLYERIVQPA